MTRTTKWHTLVRNGDIITVGDVTITIAKDKRATRANTSMIIEAPENTKIEKQELTSHDSTKAKF